MTTVLVTLAVVAAVVAVAVGFVSWRDRRRSTPDEERGAERDAESRRHRYEASRHASQSDTVRRGQPGSGGF
ncbi:hypothetical protein ACFFMM_27475 [Micromonospora chaiyaphumensis]|uniref:Uncharacterized protein n=1 Tax=Micromonospora chaiyaphumensis TaxID=307119 RepID=A0A1C4Y2Z7_9ACTN|nr:hypothetical protein [Micromonospora chaiyaphumensis]SCF15097.1 hypothetical protein GA0070214_107109 [Micromonospora chaiyaphumensis]